MAVKDNDQVENVELKEAKVIADGLGIDYADTIGLPSLKRKITIAEKERADAKKAKPKKLTDKEVRKLKATSLSKVIVTNRDQMNAGKETAYASCHNMQIDLARTIPLGMEIALEEALIVNVEAQQSVISVPKIVNGKDTGNTVAKLVPMYTVARL